ncbi:TetR/AcrR family transcriptional regulator [Microbacterium horticulturae]|uniref:TetR/AcrR family transcriptional regulator n=1 Tax=Microbacterium horticulturae TaxID=3028316 RepID=A0ABY8BY34_9MICO|nr:TetR/AcrR family transcriptional regulator [Microbacterium sp. KACC 23027]WEG09116.1 TetR/AcrR family transcriptional regulator [Microbacterium sp. KACC 23027]
MPRSAQAEEQFRSRERKIVDVARQIAEDEGWPAVTVRRLADAIGFSQPILYRHFPRGRDEIVERVVIAGYAGLADVLAEPSGEGSSPVRALIERYLAFAREHPALYEAMASSDTEIVFASDKTPEELRRAFDTVVAVVAAARADDAEVRAELLWSMLHGVSRFAAHGRLDAALDARRIDEMVALFERG